MGAGAALAMETADVTLLDSNLEKLDYCIRMGERVTRKIKENVLFSVSVKFVVLGFALAGMAHLWAAIASDVGAMILVTLNSMMLLPRRQKKVTSDQSSVCDEEDGTKAGLTPKACCSSKTQTLNTSCKTGCSHSNEEVTCEKGC